MLIQAPLIVTFDRTSVWSNKCFNSYTLQITYVVEGSNVAYLLHVHHKVITKMLI